MKNKRVKKPCRGCNCCCPEPTFSTPTVDRISDLPDSILCHILSFIPTKQAVATSILSSKWKSLWLSVLTLDFEDKTFKNFNSFQNFAFIAIFSRNTALPILSFRFKCSATSSPDFGLVDNFASFVMQRGIENLNISIATILPSSILNCKTLKVLKLENLRVDDFSHQMDLPLLKTLHLNNVYFEHHEYLVKLLSCCPILEDLHVKCLCIPDFLVGKEKFKSLLSLKSLYIEFSTYASWPNRWNWLLQMLECCPKLQHLTIQDSVNEDNLYNSWKEPPNVPHCLSSELRTCCIKDYNYYKKVELEFAKYIMQNSKVLHTMTVNSTHFEDMSARLQMFIELSSSTWDSPNCELLLVP